MARKKKDVLAPASPQDSLFARVVAILEQARAQVVRSVNSEMVHAYWHIGREIVEQEQGGRKRAAYGEAVLEDLSRRLNAEFGRGFDARNLRYMRQFFLVFPIYQALHDESESREKLNAPRSKSGVPAKRNALRSKSSSAITRDAPGLESRTPDAAPGLRPELSWTHYPRSSRRSSTTCRRFSWNSARASLSSPVKSACVSRRRIGSPDADRSPRPLANIKTFPQLIAYLRDEMDWPIARDSFEDVDDLFYCRKRVK